MSTQASVSSAPIDRKIDISNAPNAWRALSALAIREITEQIASSRFLIIALLVLAITPLAIYVCVLD